MREHITGYTLANAIRMKRTVFEGAFVIVEGVSDKLVYNLIMDREACAIQVAYGRENALSALHILEVDGFSGIAAIVDADVSGVTGEGPPSENVLFTDFHDLECVLLNSPAFDRILDEFASDDRIAAFGHDNPLIARQLALNAVPLGCLRLISLERQLCLTFDGLRFSRFVRVDDLTIDVDKMIREVMNRSQRHELKVTELARRIAEVQEAGHDCWQLSCGHDIVELLSVALRRVFSGKSTREVCREVVERSLRLAYDASCLRKTELYRALTEWEKANAPYVILDPP